jgi:hypothetical protein
MVRAAAAAAATASGPSGDGGSAIGGSEAPPPPAAVSPAAAGPKPKLEWHPITEMYFLALRAARLGVQAVILRRPNIRKTLNRMKKDRTRLILSLRQLPNGGLGMRGYSPDVHSTYMQVRGLKPAQNM